MSRRTLLPVLVQRQALADHLTRLLDKLGLDRDGPTSVGQTMVVLIPDNGRDHERRLTDQNSSMPCWFISSARSMMRRTRLMRSQGCQRRASVNLAG